MTKIILKFLISFKPILVFVFELESMISKLWASSAHKRLLYATWAIPKNPEFFDHHIDLYYQWLKRKSSWWLERGIFGSLAVKRDGELLEIACGDGFNTRNFYSGIAKEVIACDFDKTAISLAKRKNYSSNIKYILADIRGNMPTGSFDNIVWDAAIEHFTQEEIKLIMGNIKSRLKERNGVLSGYTIVERQEGKSLEQHEYEFRDMADLKRFLTPYFKNVTVFETIFPERHNLYFWASDGIIPFSKDWQHWLKNN
jgi:2-polyprenyl-3-methyl-5-hydroxy-6-metoxy-1,4-benzoquinol methylase